MSQQNLFGWARNVFIATLLVGGVLVGRLASAAEATTMLDVVTTAATTTPMTTTLEGMPVVISAQATSTFMIQEQVLVAALAQPLQADLHAVGGMAPYRWSLLSSGLPDGVWFDESIARLNGSPSRTGRFTFTVQVTDDLRAVASKILTLDVRLPNDPWFSRVDDSGMVQPIVIDLDNVTDEQIEYISDVFADDAPLIYVGPNAPENILRVNIAQMRIKPNGLYRVEGGTPSRVNENHKYSDVYYVDPVGRRHAFPTESTFNSWYEKEPTIEAVPDWKISNIPLRKNVTFRPGSFVRLENTREFYRVMPERTLRRFQDEATFQRLITSNNIVPVLPLANIADYTMDVNPIKSGNDLTTLLRIPTQPGEEMGG